MDALKIYKKAKERERVIDSQELKNEKKMLKSLPKTLQKLYLKKKADEQLRL